MYDITLAAVQSMRQTTLQANVFYMYDSMHWPEFSLKGLKVINY